MIPKFIREFRESSKHSFELLSNPPDLVSMNVILMR
jgi:hypothetical protein